MILPIVMFSSEVWTRKDNGAKSLREKNITQHFWGHKCGWKEVEEKQPGTTEIIWRAKYHRQDKEKEIKMDGAYRKDVE